MQASRTWWFRWPYTLLVRQAQSFQKWLGSVYPEPHKDLFSCPHTLKTALMP